MTTGLPTLYYRADCPFCWKVRIALAELNISYKGTETVLGEKHSSVARLSPKGSVPVLVDSTTVIWESSVIVEYLHDQSGISQLLPDTAAERSRVRLLQSYSDSVIGPALRGLVFEKRAKPSAEWDWEIIDNSETAWQACQAQLNDWISEGAFPSSFGAAHCALLPRFGIAEYYDSPIPSSFTALTNWYRETSTRESYTSTYPYGFR